MNQNSFQTLFCVGAFIAFAAISCWATADSLHLLLPTIPLIGCWIITDGFFVIASSGSKMIQGSRIDYEKAGDSLYGEERPAPFRRSIYIVGILVSM